MCFMNSAHNQHRRSCRVVVAAWLMGALIGAVSLFSTTQAIAGETQVATPPGLPNVWWWQVPGSTVEQRIRLAILKESKSAPSAVSEVYLVILPSRLHP